MSLQFTVLCKGRTKLFCRETTQIFLKYSRAIQSGVAKVDSTTGFPTTRSRTEEFQSGELDGHLPKNQPRIPYPAKVRKDQQDKQFKNFLDMFRALHINIRFVESLGTNATICQAFERVPHQQEVRRSVNYHPQ